MKAKITSTSMIEEIKNIEFTISRKEKEILALKSELEKKIEMLQKVSAFENSDIKKRTLSKYIFRNTSSVSLLDEFEELTEEGYQKYQRLVINNVFRSDSGSYFIFIIERLGNRESEGDITMSNFKAGYTENLLEYTNEQINKKRCNNKFKIGQEILFSKPFLLRAQNSSNRTGYGSEYNGYDLVYQGTLYGETTKYAFVGIVITDALNRSSINT